MSKSEPLSFRPAVKKIYWATVIVLILIEIVIVRLNYHNFSQGRWWQGLVSIFAASALNLSILWRAFFWVRPRIFSIYELADDRILIFFRGRRRELSFSEIEKVRISILSPRLWGGFKLQMKSGEMYRFPSLLKDNVKILEKVVAYRSDLVSPEKLNRFLKSSRHIEGAWARSLARMKNWKAMLFKFVLWEAALTAGLYLSGIQVMTSPHPFDQLLALAVVTYSFCYLVALGFNSLEETILFRLEIPETIPILYWAVQVGFYLVTGLAFFLAIRSVAP